ncbi:DUF397 domain-containing protein [Streptomyces sp. SID11385]|uniref:DUF397 domain-containing protein n=1 Tax=Streptomyces sp. SID11385 TaxID=2706031 RepID=UPI0013C913F1|nr:DUF397 domain-containing protein [Streptomyces sp. SID11385]NEA44501.1 DUF397 domain-containing protein [Streptomyces sp. SID11385]
MTAPEIEPARWQKSPYSQATNQCVEFADLRATRAAIVLRDSKHIPGPALLLTPAAFTTFLASVTGRS